MIYYLKYYFEFNQIEHFWVSAKKWAQDNCNYTFSNFEDMFFKPQLVYLTRQFWIIYRDIIKKYIYIEKVLIMIFYYSRFEQLITNL